MPGAARTGQCDAICELKYRYLYALDLQDLGVLETCFTEDAEVSFSNGHYAAVGIEAIVALLRATLIPGYVSIHVAVHPQIELVNDDYATGVWRMLTTSLWLDQGRESRSAGFSYDEYVRRDGSWRLRRSDTRLAYSTDIESLPENLESFPHRGARLPTREDR